MALVAGCGGRAMPSVIRTTCRYSMTAPEVVADSEAECEVRPDGYATTLSLTRTDGTWFTITYAPSAHPPELSFTAAWATQEWRCDGEAPGSWAVKVDAPSGLVLTSWAQCADGDPAHAVGLTVQPD